MSRLTFFDDVIYIFAIISRTKR